MGLKGLGYFFREWDVWVKFEWLCSRYFFFFRLGVVWLAGRIKGFVNEIFSLCFFYNCRGYDQGKDDGIDLNNNVK